MSVWQVARSLRLLEQPAPSLFRNPQLPAQHGVELRYLGTAGFVVRGHGRTLVLDPYVTRTKLTELGRPLIADEALVRSIVPEADDVLVGHAHYDHVLDAPSLCRATGARLVGSPAVCEVGRAAGLPSAQLVTTRGREDIASGAWTLRGLPSLHGKVMFGRVPIPGDITAPPPWPPRLFDLKHGLVLNWQLRAGDFSLVHVDSADFVREELRGLRADVVCLCAVGRRHRPRYVEEIVELLEPRYVVPCHWDTMLTPIDAAPDLIPGVDLPGMVREIRALGVTPIVLPLLGMARF